MPSFFYVLLTCLHELFKIILHHLVNMIRVGVRVPYLGSHRYHGVMQDLCCSSPLLQTPSAGYLVLVLVCAPLGQRSSAHIWTKRYKLNSSLNIELSIDYVLPGTVFNISATVFNISRPH